MKVKKHMAVLKTGGENIDFSSKLSLSNEHTDMKRDE